MKGKGLSAGMGYVDYLASLPRLENVDRVGVEMTDNGQFRVWALPVIPGFVPEKRKRVKTR